MCLFYFLHFLGFFRGSPPLSGTLPFRVACCSMYGWRSMVTRSSGLSRDSRYPLILASFGREIYGGRICRTKFFYDRCQLDIPNSPGPGKSFSFFSLDIRDPVSCIPIFAGRYPGHCVQPFAWRLVPDIQPVALDGDEGRKERHGQQDFFP